MTSLMMSVSQDQLIRSASWAWEKILKNNVACCQRLGTEKGKTSLKIKILWPDIVLTLFLFDYISLILNKCVFKTMYMNLGSRKRVANVHMLAFFFKITFKGEMRCKIKNYCRWPGHTFYLWQKSNNNILCSSWWRHTTSTQTINVSEKWHFIVRHIPETSQGCQGKYNVSIYLYISVA